MSVRRITVEIPMGQPEFHVGTFEVIGHGILIIKDATGAHLAAYWPCTWLRVLTEAVEGTAKPEDPA